MPMEIVTPRTQLLPASSMAWVSPRSWGYVGINSQPRYPDITRFHPRSHFCSGHVILIRQRMNSSRDRQLRQLLFLRSLPASRELLAGAQLNDALGYIHLDLDVLDPRVGQANSLPVRGGLSVEQLTAAIAVIRSQTQLGAAAITSYAPEFDVQRGVCRAAFAALDAILGDGA